MSLLDVLLPPACAGCGRSGAVLCRDCLGRLRPPSDPGDLFFAADAGVVIGDEMEVAVAAFAYEGVLRRALQQLKYGSGRRVAKPLALAALPALGPLLTISGPAPLVPIPVHITRERERGYNQATLLAAQLGRAAHLPVTEPLSRPRPTTKQHRLDRAGRMLNMRGALRLTVARPPPTVILIDDILTTSATLEACATVLRRAGTRHVYGFCIGREV
jgi:ComF family protein